MLELHFCFHEIDSGPDQEQRKGRDNDSFTHRKQYKDFKSSRGFVSKNDRYN